MENEPQLADADQRLGPLVAWKSKFCCWMELNKHARFLPSLGAAQLPGLT